MIWHSFCNKKCVKTGFLKENRLNLYNKSILNLKIHLIMKIITKETRLLKAIVLLLLAVFSLLIIPACEDTIEDPYKDKKARHRFFRCKVDGKEWTNQIFPNFIVGDNSGMFFNQDIGKLKIHMRNVPDKETKKIIGIKISEGLKLGDNKLVPNRLTNYTLFKPYKRYVLDETYDNNILSVIDIDTIKHIIKATFEFRMIEEETGEKILIEDGEFDWWVLTWEDSYSLKKKEHTFMRCKINDREWFSSYYPHSWYNEPMGRLDIEGLRGSDWDEQFVHLYWDSNLKLGINKLQSDSVAYYQIPESMDIYLSFYLDSTYNNFIDIKEINADSQIIKGTYQFRAVKDQNYHYFVLYDTATIVDGEFDIKIDQWYN